jgi:branched-subunit amino acid aminotransferase/4-amino-4-deoxychorismate lyase
VTAATLPSLLRALGAAVDQFGAGVPKIATIVLSPGADAHRPLEVHIAVTQVPPKPSNTSPSPTFATVLGPPREIPVGKDSGWVAQRQQLEALRPPGAAEVLLCTQDGRLLEGLVTNVYIIAEGTNNGGEKDTEGPVLLTAGMEDGVVWGTMRQRVLAAASDLGLRVIETAPPAEGRAAWREAFLTNALRRVQALGQLECGAANVWGLEPWAVEFEPVSGPWTAKIAARVEAALKGTDVRGLTI